MDHHEGLHSALTIALLRGLYLAIIMDRHDRPHSVLTIALLRGLYIPIIMDRHEGPQSAHSIAFLRGLYFGIIWTVMKVPTVQLLYPCLEDSTLLSHYNGPS
jgi:hypothetical protein